MKTDADPHKKSRLFATLCYCNTRCCVAVTNAKISVKTACVVFSCMLVFNFFLCFPVKHLYKIWVLCIHHMRNWYEVFSSCCSHECSLRFVLFAGFLFFYSIPSLQKEENGKVVSTLPPSQTDFLQSGLGPGQEYEVSISIVKNNTRGPQTSKTVTTSRFLRSSSVQAFNHSAKAL